MSIIMGIIVPAILFLITLPLQSLLFLLRQSLKAMEKRVKKNGGGSLGNKLGLSKGSDKLRAELGLSPKKNNNSMLAKVTSKMKIASLKAMQLAIRAISMLISLLRTVASTLITLVITAVMMVLPVCLAVIVATSGIIMFYNSSSSSSSSSNKSAVVSSNSSSSKSGTSSASSVKVSKIRYNQSSYSERINSSTPLTSGCGWCSLSHMMMNLNPDKCGKMEPIDWIPIMPDSVKNQWGGSMGWSAPQAWVDALNKDLKGKYGKYKLVTSVTGLPVCDASTKKVIQAIKKYMKDDDTQVVLSTSTGLFTGDGHIILCNSIYDNGKYFSVTDSNSRASKTVGIPLKTKDHIYDDKFNFFKFPTNKTSYRGSSYSFKCYWVIKRIK